MHFTFEELSSALHFAKSTIKLIERLFQLHDSMDRCMENGWSIFSMSCRVWMQPAAAAASWSTSTHLKVIHSHEMIAQTFAMENGDWKRNKCSDQTEHRPITNNCCMNGAGTGHCQCHAKHNLNRNENLIFRHCSVRSKTFIFVEHFTWNLNFFHRFFFTVLKVIFNKRNVACALTNGWLRFRRKGLWWPNWSGSIWIGFRRLYLQTLFELLTFLELQKPKWTQNMRMEY